MRPADRNWTGRIRLARVTPRSAGCASPGEEGAGGRVPLSRTAEEQAEEDRFLALYGPWAPLSPAELVHELAAFSRPWWVIGGWAIEAASEYRREHDDTDISILACDVPEFVRAMSGRWHVWNNVGGVLRPLGGRWKTADEPRSQLWLRANASSPWVVDVPLTPDRDGLWTNRHIPDHVAPLEDVTWQDAAGIRYLRPEIVLFFKARLRRPKDDRDLEATLPVLDEKQRAWLRKTLSDVVPDHPWITQL
jgi:hypothetical protein